MQKRKIIQLLPLSLILLLTSCFHRPSCDSKNDVKLGEVEYSTDFQDHEIERSANALTFSNDNASLTLQRLATSPTEPHRLRDHDICQSLDIKPYTAYAYYEYENLNTIFSTNSLLLSIEPSMFKDGEERKEVIYFTLSQDESESIKAGVPVDNDAVIGDPIGPNNPTFKLFAEIELNGVLFEEIWVCQENKNGIYYSKETGLVALEVNEVIFLKD